MNMTHWTSKRYLSPNEVDHQALRISSIFQFLAKRTQWSILFHPNSSPPTTLFQHHEIVYEISRFSDSQCE
jgi:hypothetical protein